VHHPLVVGPATRTHAGEIDLEDRKPLRDGRPDGADADEEDTSVGQ
jgi:hypothetical protein